MEGYTPPVYSLTFSPDGKTLASGFYGAVRFWNVQEQKQTGLLEGYDAWAGTGIAFNPDGKIMASIVKNEIYLFDVQEQKQIGTLKGHTDQVRSITFSPDGKILVSGSLDYTVRLWDVAGQKQIGTLRNGSHAHCVAISPDSGTIAAAIGGESLIRLWDAQTQREIGTLRDPEAGWSLAFSPDGNTMALAFSELIRLWDFKEQKQIGALQVHAIRVDSIVFSPDGKWLASVSMDGNDRIWDVQEQKQIAILEGHGGVDSVAFSPDGKWLASGGDKGTIILWEVNLTVPGWSVEPTGKLPGTWGEVKKTELLQNFPNPFNPETWIPYQLSEDVDVAIRICSISGHLVKALHLGCKPAGFYTTKDKAAYWDGKNEAGEPVSSGTYFYTIQAGEFAATKRMVIAR